MKIRLAFTTPAPTLEEVAAQLGISKKRSAEISEIVRKAVSEVNAKSAVRRSRLKTSLRSASRKATVRAKQRAA